MLHEDQNLEFLKNKIMQIKTGLCCIDDDSFAVRAHIVEVLYADSEGNLYFIIMKPLISSTDKSNFGITLTFYKKIFDYYVQLKADAEIEKDGDDTDMENAYVLIKAKITEAEFVEHKKPFTQYRMFDTVKDNFKKLSKALAFLFY